ncbi:MAG: hypothetical protein WCE54_14985 [Ignavibacteriaceae bacterium]
MNRRYFILIQICFLFLLQSCATTSLQKIKENQLCEAYEEDSIALLNNFFDNWSNEIKSISNNEKLKLSDTLKTVYKVYGVFIHNHLTKYHNEYNATKYCMVQNEIKFRITNDNLLLNPILPSEIAYSKNLLNFRPVINDLGSQIVYVNYLYASALNSFIKGKCGKKTNSKYSGEPWNCWPRANFLSKVVSLSASMMGFHFHTLPEISLTFNKSLNEVIISACFGSIWTKELYVLSEDRWKFKESLSTTVE